MNIELTTYCPLACPQCYCQRLDNKHIDLDKATFWLKEAGAMGVKFVCLSGGETLCYPYINEIVRIAAKYCGNVSVALSGYGFTQTVYTDLIHAGISEIFISLNGSTEDINVLSRDGYHFAISALALIKKNNFHNTWINWVAHKNNVNDFDNMLALANTYDVKNLVVMALKPNAANRLTDTPTAGQMVELASKIKKHRGKPQVLVESCYSPFLAYIRNDTWFGNLNTGTGKGCGAGLTGFNVNINGFLSPCRHLDFFENPPSLVAYWYHSPVLNRLRTVEHEKKQPCAGCKLSPYCRHCIAINNKLNGGIYIGNETCVINRLIL
jgi:pyrroloquinoline quinone biosynthesis protein E